jgi:hypothetical protein
MRVWKLSCGGLWVVGPFHKGRDGADVVAKPTELHPYDREALLKAIITGLEDKESAPWTSWPPSRELSLMAYDVSLTISIPDDSRGHQGTESEPCRLHSTGRGNAYDPPPYLPSPPSTR